MHKMGDPPGKANVYIETDGIGHVYVEIEGVVYTYGRYDGSYSPSSGGLAPMGDGILLRLEGEHATKYIADRTDKYPTEKYSVRVNASKVKGFYNELYKNGSPLKNQSGYKLYARKIDTYNLVGPGGNNCTTIVNKALNYGGANMGAPQTPAGMLHNFRQAEYIKRGYNPGLSGPRR